MRQVLIVQRGLIKTGSRRNVNFNADNRFDTGFGGFFIKLDGSEHRAVIGGGHRMHIEF